MGNYVLATTTETGQSGPKRPGAINGGFYPRKPDWPAQLEIPGVGQYVSFTDTEGNRVSVLQPIPRNSHAPKPA